MLLSIIVWTKRLTVAGDAQEDHDFWRVLRRLGVEVCWPALAICAVADIRLAIVQVSKQVELTFIRDYQVSKVVSRLADEETSHGQPQELCAI